MYLLSGSNWPVLNISCVLNYAENSNSSVVKNSSNNNNNVGSGIVKSHTLPSPAMPALAHSRSFATSTPSAGNTMAASKTPQFSDAELSEIFQIDFAEIFGSHDLLSTPNSNYKGINLPSPKNRGTSTSLAAWCVFFCPQHTLTQKKP